MKNITKISIIMALSINASAGDMGPTERASTIVPFIQGEGTYNWIAYNQIDLNGINSNKLYRRWGGRFAGGFTKPHHDNFKFSTEFGYGYYGRVRETLANNIVKGYFSIDGLDILIGTSYSLRQLEIFFKGGAMIQNRRAFRSTELTEVYQANGSIISGVVSENVNDTQVLPTLKIGGIYNWNANIGIILSYMHVFGSYPDIRSTTTASDNGQFAFYTNTSKHTQNPALDVFLFGVQYNFT